MHTAQEEGRAGFALGRQGEAKRAASGSDDSWRKKGARAGPEPQSEARKGRRGPRGCSQGDPEAQLKGCERRGGPREDWRATCKGRDRGK